MEAKPDLGRRVATALVALRRLLAVHDRRLVLESLLMGTAGALCARAFELAVVVAQSWLLGGVAGYKPPGLPSEGGTLVAAMGPHGLWLVPLATTLGGLLSGLLVFTLAPEAEGHGTDAAVKAYHEGEGRIRARVPVVKLVASALTIGSGGAAGREGPTALTTAGIGSVYATLTRRPERDRRLLVLMGMAAGLSAMFRSPIGAAIFAVEVLYSEMEFETGALIFTLLASVVAYGVNGALVGFDPLFAVPGDWTPGAAHYLAFAILGVASGAVATLLVAVFYTFRRAFVSLPLPAALKPALGGLGVGALALLAPQVLGGGYGWLQLAMGGQLGLGLLVALIFAKVVAFSLTITSGGSGGVFAPSLFVGGMLGAALALAFHVPPAPFVVVGMASVFAGAGRVPIATMLMVTEMTGGYHLLAAAALAVTLAYVVETTLSEPLRTPSLYEAQVPRQADSPAHEADQVRWAMRFVGCGPHVSRGRLVEVFSIPQGSDAAGKTVGALLGTSEAEVLAIFRREEYVRPSPGLLLVAGDELLLAYPEGALARLLDARTLARAA